MRIQFVALALAAIVGGDRRSRPSTSISIGDSTMADKPTPETNPERGWGQLLPRLLRRARRVHNHAVNGRSTKSFIDEGKWGAVVARAQAGRLRLHPVRPQRREDRRLRALRRSAHRRIAGISSGSCARRGPRAPRRFCSRRSCAESSTRRARSRTRTARIHCVVRDVAARPQRSARRSPDARPRTSFAPRDRKARRSSTSGSRPANRRCTPTAIRTTRTSRCRRDRVAGLAAAAIARSSLPLRQFVRSADNPPREDAEIPLWPSGAPGALGSSPDDQPAITPFIAPKAAATGAAMLVFPGGGYEHLAWDKEGTSVARWLNTLGVSAFVVRYRLGPRYHHPTMLTDARRAVRVVRARANDWGIDPSRIGVIGFSAGGHMASTAATQWTAGDPTSADPSSAHRRAPIWRFSCIRSSR